MILVEEILKKLIIMIEDILICPLCKNKLGIRQNTLICPNCGKTCSIDENSFDFLGDENCFGSEITLEEMNRVLEIAFASGWKNAVSVIKQKHPNLQAYLDNDCRIDWLFHCIDYLHVNSCLDIVSGYGGNTFELAKYYNEVWSLDADKQRISFQKIRQAQEKVNNIRFIRNDWLQLPFPDNYFDLVVANRVLESIGMRDISKNPQKLQEAFLREVRRVLKPHGCVYMGTENRFAYTKLGVSHDHSGLSFTSIVPRKLSEKFIRYSGKACGYGENTPTVKWKDYRTYTYSMKGYEKLFKDADYASIDFYWRLSSNGPSISGRFHDDSFPYYLRWNRNNSNIIDNNLKKWLVKIGSYFPDSLLKLLNQTLCESFLIFAYKQNKPDTFESILLSHTAPNTGFIILRSGENTKYKINYFILKSKGLKSVAKFSPNSRSDALSLEENTLSNVSGFSIDKNTINTIPVFFEPPFPGSQLQQFSFVQNEKALTWLLDFQKKTSSGYWNSTDLLKELQILCAYLADLPLQNDIKMRTIHRMKEFADSLDKVKIPVTAEHGDYCRLNIIIDKNDIHVLDWEFFNPNGNPLFDIGFFLLDNLTLNIFLKSGKNIRRKIPYYKIFKLMLFRYAKETKLPEGLILQSCSYAILRCMKRTITNSVDVESEYYTKKLLYLDKLYFSTFNDLLI
jgi:ubiquinone/menaquinone biosynthesis C-methylase UbiE